MGISIIPYPPFKRSGTNITQRNVGDKLVSTGEIDLNDNDLTNIKGASFGIYDAGNSGATKTIDWANGNVQKVVMTGNCTFSFSNPVAGATSKLYLIQDATGGRTHTWTGGGLNIDWHGNSEPAWSTTANEVNIGLFDYDGTTWRGDGFVEGTISFLHSALDDLTVGDDHTQYALLAGRSGGQVIKGGTDASDDLELNSTNHATKGQILLKDNAKLEDDVKIQLGTGNDGEIYVNTDNVIVKNITADKDIEFWGNDGGVDTMIAKLDVSEGQLSGLVKSTSGVLGNAVAGTDYEAPVAKGNLTEATSSVLTITDGAGAVIGTGTTIQVKEAGSAQNGYLSSANWTTFNNKADFNGVRMIKVAIGTNATYESTTLIPADSEIVDVRVNVGTEYSADATIKVGYTEDDDAIITTTDIDLQTAGDTRIEQETAWYSSARKVLITISDTPAAGAGVVRVFFVASEA